MSSPMNNPAKIVLLVTILLVGALTILGQGAGLLLLGLVAAFLLTAKTRTS
jgi:hypothetical protein